MTLQLADYNDIVCRNCLLIVGSNCEHRSQENCYDTILSHLFDSSWLIFKDRSMFLCSFHLGTPFPRYLKEQFCWKSWVQIPSFGLNVDFGQKNTETSAVPKLEYSEFVRYSRNSCLFQLVYCIIIFCILWPTFYMQIIIINVKKTHHKVSVSFSAEN